MTKIRKYTISEAVLEQRRKAGQATGKAKAESGAKGGSVTSKRKAKAARENGKKGGRPRKSGGQ
jgi:hypothetical protein